MSGSRTITVAEILPGELGEEGEVVLRLVGADGQSFNLTLPPRLLGPLLAALPTPASPTHPAHAPAREAEPVCSWSVGREKDGRAALTLVTDAGAVGRFAMTAGQIDSIASLTRLSRGATPGTRVN